LPAFLALRCRSVPLTRSMNDVFTRLPHAGDRRAAAARMATVPKINVVTTDTTRPFARVLRTVA
jgi:hypothetical protein